MARHGHLGVVGAAALGLLWCAVPVAAAGTRTAPGFVRVATVAPSTDEPGALACARPSFCLEIAAGNEALQFVPSTIVSRDAGRTWRRAAPLPAAALPSGASGSTGVSVLIVGPGSRSFSSAGAIAGLSAQCTAPGTCVVGGGAALARTTNAARSWTLRTGLPSRWALGVNVACLGDGACLAVGRYRHGASTAWLGARARSFARLDAATLPHGFSPRSIACPTSGRCLLAGTVNRTSGVLLLARGLGHSLRWRRLTMTPRRVLRALSCPSATVCVGILDFLGAKGGVRAVDVVRSSDGGLRWRSELRAPDGIDAPTAVGCTSVLDCATSVGALRVNDDDDDFDVTSFITSQLEGVPATRLTTAYTTDGGSTWREHAVVVISALDDGSGWGSCLGPASCVADGAGTSGGRTQATVRGRWQTVPTNLGATDIPSVTCTTDSTCELVDVLQGTSGYDARLLTSRDDGLSWAATSLPRGDEPTQAAGCQGPSTCEVVAVAGVRLEGGQEGNDDYSRSMVELLATTDGGVTWTASRIAGPGWIPMAASCSSTTQCSVLVTSEDGLLGDLASTQDGTTWTTTPVAIGLGVISLGFGISNVSLSCGAGGTCLFLDPSTLGVGSTLLRSSDGGATWIVATPPGPQGADQYAAVSCTTAGDCSIVANPGTTDARLYSTTDGGATWSTPADVPPMASGEQSEAVTLSCWAAGSCVVVGIDGAVETGDGGATWTHVALPGSTSPFTVSEGPAQLACSATSTCALVLVQTGFGADGPTESTSLFALRG